MTKKPTSVFRQTARKANLHLRADLLTAIRRFFSGQGYLEVETPVLIPAPAPEAHIDALPCGDGYLHTSPELCMKRLLAAGYPRIFQICKCFRQKERGNRHLPEMTLLEWYTADADYRHMMDQCEALITFVFKDLGKSHILTYQQQTIDLHRPWPRLTVAQSFEKHGTLSMKAALEAGRFDDIMGLEIEPQLGRQKPIFLHDYPAACGALARRKADQPDLAERFELYIGGLELCNAFSELTDPAEQRRRFEQERLHRRNRQQIVYPMPEPFLADLERMPAATGNALGVDRLAMLLADTACIDDVVSFTPEEL